MKNIETTPHDGLFKNIFKEKRNARDLLEVVLPENIVSHINMNSVIVEDTSYIDESMSKHFSDLVLSLDLIESPDKVNIYCILEHKSTPQPLVGLQLLRYMSLKWTELEKNGQIFGSKLPPIIPIVIYQGEQKWKIFKSFQDLVHFPSEEFKSYIPNFSFEFFDIPRLNENKLKTIKVNVIVKFYLEMIKSLYSEDLKIILP